jgi:hypothetical protein
VYVWVIAWGLLCLWLAGCPGQALAQVVMEARLGLQGTLRLGKWNVVTVQVQNSGPAITGLLGIRTWLGSETRGDLHTVTWSRAIDLPPGARKRVTLAVPILSIADPVEVSLRAGTHVLAERQLDLREALHAEQIIVGLTRDVSLDFLATVFNKTSTRVVYLSPADLPQHWSAYDSITAIIVKGLSLQALNEAQYAALRAWMASGGTLMVAADSQYTLLTESRLKALLPVEVTGMQQVTGSAALSQAYDVPFPETPMSMARAHLTRGQVLIGVPEAPLLAQRTFGKGRVLFLGVDYAMQPFSTWQGRGALWRDLLKTPDTVDFMRTFAELGMLDETHPIMKLLGRPVLAFPSHLTLGVCVFAYCGVLALLFWRMSRRQAHVWRYWGGVAVLIVVLSLYAFSPWLARGLDQAALCFDGTTMEVLPETEYAYLRGYLGVFSVRGGQFALPLQQPDTMLRHTFTRGVGQAGKHMEASLATGLTLQHIALDPWALRVFSTESMTPTPLQIAVQPHTVGLTVQIANRGTRPLYGAMVVAQGKLFSLGLVAPGEKLSDDIYPALYSADSAQEMTWRVLLKRRPAETDARLAYLQEVLLQQYFGDKRLAEASETPFLTGWLLTPTTVIPDATAAPAQGVTLVVSRLTP